MGSIKIEELQRDIMFKKMDQVDLFYWDEILQGNIKFKQYLEKVFILQSIKNVQTIDNGDEILLNIYNKKFLGTEKKSGSLILDSQNTNAILKIDGVEIDRFIVKNDNEGLKLCES
jgi:hypothetical protein